MELSVTPYELAGNAIDIHYHMSHVAIAGLP